jgi:hypothetical protein
MKRIKRALKLTLLAEMAVIILNYIIGTMIGAMAPEDFFYVLILVGLSISPFSLSWFLSMN